MIIASLLLFPVIMNYLWPYVIIDGASQGIVNGSLIVFGLSHHLLDDALHDSGPQAA
ncbi:MAG: hypothetical protein JXA33_25580 [Anaerolineae bacterium]|nr:hypothetical protein [Anaerolineae bacterium]